MQSIDTLSDFLTVAGSGHAATTGYRVYDLSRRVQPIDRHEFARIERGETPFPYPRQQQAFLGVVFWNTTRADDPYIWFIRLPLDERGLFQHAARQHFLSIVVAALESETSQHSAQEQEKILAQNPYIFTPDEARRAAFHAQVSRDLNHPPSIYFEDAEAWLSEQGRHNNSEKAWQNIGIQGIHDVSCRRLNSPAIINTLKHDFKDWPEPLQNAVVEAIEHQQIPEALAQHWRDELASHLQSNKLNTDVILSRLRLLSSFSHQDTTQKVVQQLLQKLPNQEPDRQDILLALGARCWSALANTANINAYFTALAAESEAVFVGIFRDLVMLPELRGLILNLFRQPNLAPELQLAFQQLANRTRSQA
ncbi:MAG: DUF3549 family protein [Aliidiomarina sp.]|uniref:DUF3549 family protein n=1 Tax=Aliidiomarina sp. TaxID=1872439 RepID=UPI0025C3F4F6|nr:DUF3549 family protein [Aliidiomarina sp.]MCH8500475.1 DUF3549 family protein [Aliidiomarina sp.]